MKFFLGTLLLGASLFADIAVIVNVDSGVESMQIKEIKKIFMGKSRHFSNGRKAVPIDQRSESDIYEAFYTSVANKDAVEMSKYRARRQFSGEGNAPRSVESAGEVIAQVKNNESMIGYVDRIDVTDEVRVVYTIK